MYTFVISFKVLSYSELIADTIVHIYVLLMFYMLLDFSFWFDTLSKWLTFGMVHCIYRGVTGYYHIFCIALKIIFVSANNVDRDEMSHYSAHHLGLHIGPRSAVGNVSGYRCVSDCRSRGREFDPGPVPYFRGDWSWNNFYGHSPPFRWFIQEGFLSVTSESMCTNYWLTACSSLLRKKCG